MATPDPAYLNAPIPGMSLTTEPGNRPWESPPLYATVEDALEFYIGRIIADQNSHDEILSMLELQVPVESVANILNKSSIMEGYHSIDVGILVLPAIEEMIMAVADMYGAKYIESMDKALEGFMPNPRAVRAAMKELQKSMAMPEEEKASVTETLTAEPEAPMGLMARPQTKMESPDGI